eukprot:TRINITY_DN14128_c0_g2_i1.p1 TRINITY_DN14128_c0_g2~~TRINITY_DN14128_c0_g2_i1.p1  ORF type:complete len:679 (+),score=99.34 TRINITY_DN14128_c0_g2_i1:62-2098(+)
MAAISLLFILGSVAAAAAAAAANTDCGFQDACARELGPSAGSDLDEDLAEFVQLRRRARKQMERDDPVVEVDSTSDVPVKDGEWVRDISLPKSIMDNFMPPKRMPKAGQGCQETEFLDCLKEEVKKKCPAECNVQDWFTDLVSSKARNHTAGAHQARNQIVSNLQSMVEAKYKELNAQANLPDSIHKALMEFDKCLGAVSNGGGDATNPHVADIGYPLTAVEAIILKLGLADRFLNISQSDAQLYYEFVDVIVKYGWNSPESIDFYKRALYLDSYLPLDLGWINEFLGTLGTYSLNFGIHAYRKAPWTLAKGYDVDYSVYELPDEGKPLVVGLLADWGAGSPQSLQLIQEMHKQSPDIVIHLGDTYYSGTPAEAREFFLDPMRAVFAGSGATILQIPGNHDYYSEGGKGFFEVIDELGHQEASFFALRGERWQIIALDTGLLDNFNLLFPIGSAMENAVQNTLPFLPADQKAWALHQLEVGRTRGLKTIVLSHHQLFSRTESLGVANSFVKESSTIPDRLKGTYFTAEWKTPSEELPGNLPNGTKPTANTRLLHQLPPEAIEGITAWYWGHEHAAAVFKPYAGLERGRMIGNAAIGEPISRDLYAPSNDTDGTPWGGHPEVIPGSETGTGDNFWNLGFAIVTLDGPNAHAQYFEMQDSQTAGQAPTWGPAKMFFEENY